MDSGKVNYQERAWRKSHQGYYCLAKIECVIKIEYSSSKHISGATDSSAKKNSGLNPGAIVQSRTPCPASHGWLPGALLEAPFSAQAFTSDIHE
jgi:hypothetical protein